MGLVTDPEVREFLARWAKTSERRDPEANADLYLRDPPPVVTFTDGERAQDWLDVRVRVARDFERAIIERVDVHELASHEVASGVHVATFEYDLYVRDMWGHGQHATRHATMTLVRTKDGLRIASAHFSA